MKGHEEGRMGRTACNRWDVGKEGKRDFQVLLRCLTEVASGWDGGLLTGEKPGHNDSQVG